MYVIFPADEVVYLSYGRLIYVSSTPEVRDPQLAQLQQHFQFVNQDLQSSSSQEAPTNQPRSSCQSTGSHSSAPSTSTSSSRSFRSVHSAPFLTQSHQSNEKLTPPKQSKSKDDLSERPPERPKRQKEKNSGSFLRLPTRKSFHIRKSDPRDNRKLSFSDFARTNNRDFTLPVPSTPVSSADNRPRSRERSPRGLEPGRYKTEYWDNKLPVAVTQYPGPDKSPQGRKKGLFGSVRHRKAQNTAEMAANESPLKDLIHPSYNDHLKTHNSVTFKLVRTVSDFTQQLSQMYEHHAEELQLLVSNFRKRNGELRKERPACPSSLFHTWETLLQEVEIDSQTLGDVASILGRQVSRPLLEKSFYRKIQSRKVFTHRESYDTIIAKTEEKLAKCRQDYKNAYLSYLTTPTTDSLSAYFNTHNAYIQQLHATNGMLEEYGKETLPQLLQELEEIYSDLCSTVADSVLQGAEVLSTRAMEQCRRYEGLVSQCKSVSGPNDLSHLTRALPVPTTRGHILRRPFVPPQPPPSVQDQADDGTELLSDSIPPPLRDELVIDRLSAVQVRPSFDALKREATDLEVQIRQIQDALDNLLRVQQRSVEANLFNKANEIQEDISMKRFELRVAQIHLSAINAQKELFAHKLESGDATGRERKNSSSSTNSMKSKWMKAFKSLKTPPPEEKKNQMYHAVSTIIQMRKNGAAATRELLKGDPDAHNFQEYTYKKITPCDVCSQVLRGHTRQGLKCRICKMNVHVDCQEKASKCEAKARLLRRQKSTSEIETKIPDTTADEESIGIDNSYSGMPTMNRQLSIKSDSHILEKESDSIIDRRQVTGPCSSDGSMRRRLFAGMKSLTGFGSRSRHGSPGHRSISLPERTSMRGSTSAVNINPQYGTNSVAPHSPRRQKLNLRMKSLSLDSPESTEHVQRRKHHGAQATSDPHSNQSSSSRIQFSVPERFVQSYVARSDLKSLSTPSSPVHNRRLLSAKNIRMSSVELPDENEKSPSSASTSPCPSPVGAKKSHRLLPTNLYVVLYNFKSRHQDELDLKAGYKVTVIDTSDPDWWKGKCLGRVGYFPSKYCSKLSPGEKALQVTHNLQVSDGDNGLMLLRDQIVIQIGEELDGMVMIRSGDNRQGICPIKFLQEV
ncbi:guanine nucleotide exchange factor VAV2 isoform X10 [Onthophagus taurus]|uniref:guanine nucleotide exchange factor VAV2 isoform X10 n=1 Tax=Onthophagus taurus TaxID=166361 RepID=UPI0039BDCBAE